ncbi:hypothetical protein Hthe01_13450 [Hydrogenophilus thermoluteolus]|uniref:hypothetical protein n=1 Tax=Hydrogenophilus thermoluteolus TaxID=297 RepID=UPI0024A215E5|nr:hypothetical protein [Hydrogenophilus thermoluteolus]GLW60996.1 hypothetical protein Hthe01_13450 [Hydrogenophilus thermoluteolus]
MNAQRHSRIRIRAQIWRAGLALCALGSLSGTLLAQTAAPALPPAEWLGRLFFTQEERFAIEQARSHADRTTKPANPAPLPRLDGVVLAPRERRGAWIGGRFVADGSELGGWRLNVYRNGIVLTNTQGESYPVPVGAQLPIAP